MRKALIAVAVATALFAVGAFAASFSVRSEDVASGTDPVTACAAQVDVDFEAPQLDSGTGHWTVDQATVTFLNASDAVVTTCDAHDARLAIDSGSGFVAVGGLVAVGPPNGTAVFNFGSIDVEDIVGASVVVDGATLSADL